MTHVWLYTFISYFWVVSLRRFFIIQFMKDFVQPICTNEANISLIYLRYNFIFIASHCLWFCSIYYLICIKYSYIHNNFKFKSHLKRHVSFPFIIFDRLIFLQFFYEFAKYILFIYFLYFYEFKIDSLKLKQKLVFYIFLTLNFL